MSDARMTEDMAVIPGIPGYLVNVNGDIWSVKRRRFLSLCVASNGYLIFTASDCGVRRSVSAHRAVALAFLGDSAGRQVNHRNGIKTDNRVVNLEWASRSENGKHAYKHGLAAISPLKRRQFDEHRRLGPLANRALTQEQADQVRSAFVGGASRKALALRFNVRRSIIERIIANKIYRTQV